MITAEQMKLIVTVTAQDGSWSQIWVGPSTYNRLTEKDLANHVARQVYKAVAAIKRRTP